MNFVEYTKTVASNFTTGSSVAAGTVALTVDTIGYQYLSVEAIYSTTVLTSAVAGVLTLRAGDTTAALSDYTATYGSLTAATASVSTAAAQTSSASVVRLDIDLRGKPRYISLATAPQATAATAVIVGRLSKGEVGPESASQKGVYLQYRG